jgi:hypothetical protein
MKRSFTNIDVECWEERARLGTTWPTICLSHAEAALGGEILEAIDELAAEAPVAKRKLTFRSFLRKRPIDTLRVRFDSEHPDLRVMNINRNDNAMTIELTAVGLRLLRDAVMA